MQFRVSKNKNVLHTWVGLLFSFPVYAISIAYFAIQAQKLVLHLDYSVNAVDLPSNLAADTNLTLSTSKTSDF
jgi:hypothetical protein